MITLKILSKATPQEVFDQVRDHLLKQMAKSLDRKKGGYKCAYRGDNGLTCAAGCLIGDEEYTSEMEGMGWASLVYKFDITKNNSRLINELQMIHDATFPEYWELELEKLAKRYNLKF